MIFFFGWGGGLRMVLWYCLNQNINLKLKFVLTVFDFVNGQNKGKSN